MGVTNIHTGIKDESCVTILFMGGESLLFFDLLGYRAGCNASRHLSE